MAAQLSWVKKAYEMAELLGVNPGNDVTDFSVGVESPPTKNEYGRSILATVVIHMKVSDDLYEKLMAILRAGG